MLIRRSLPEARVYDLLDSAVYLALSQNPGRITEELDDDTSIIAIDEIQSDAQVPRTTVYEYFDNLRDTLIQHELPAW